MFQIFKALSLAVVLGLSMLPGHAPAALHHSPISLSLAAEGGRAGALKPDQESVAGWTAAETALEAQVAAEQAAEQAARETAAAAAAAAAIPAHQPFTNNPGAAAVKQLIVQDFSSMGQSAVDWGLRVAACESGYNPNAYNPDGASGVFQFMPGTFRGTPYGNQNIFDASANVAAAAWYYGQHGGGAWSCK